MKDSSFGSDIYTITDDDGKTYQLEHVDTVEIDGVLFSAFLPADMDEESEDYGIVILKAETGEDGEEYYVNPTDEEEQKAFDKVMENLFSEDEDDE